jgi:DNA-binding winged helix-turn-helix (wHTH) protein
LLVASIRLSENLELDPQAYELRRGGRSVRPERIPMEILLFLVERRPELVTREQIAEKVWGPGVFVDTANSINAAIFKIRHSLRDDPENPRFIRTITGKGYRFIAEPLEPPIAPPVEETRPGSRLPSTLRRLRGVPHVANGATAEECGGRRDGRSVIPGQSPGPCSRSTP